MVMGSLFGEEATAYYPEDEEEDDELDPLKPVYGPPVPPEPAAASFMGQQMAQPVYGPPAPSYEPLNPNPAGFRGPENPPNVTPGDQYAPNPDLGIITPFHPVNEALFNPDSGILTPYLDPAREFTGNVGAAAGRIVDPFGIGSRLSEQVGVPSPEDAGRFLGEGVVGNSIEEFIANSAFGGGVTGYDDVIRLARGTPGMIDDVIRAGLPEPSLLPGFGAGVPPGPGIPIDPLKAWDEAAMGPLPGGPDLGQGPAMMGGETRANQGRVFIGGAENQSILEELQLAEQIAADDAAMARGLWGIGSDYPSLPNAGNLPDGSPGSRMGAPLAYDPRLAPNADELDVIEQARQAGRASYATEPDTAQQMQDALNEARRQESILTGGGVPREPTPSTPPPASTYETAGARASEALANMPPNPTPTPFDANALRSGVGENPLPADVPGREAFAQARDNAILGSAAPETIRQEAARIAPDVGITPDRAQQILKNWEFNAQITQDYANNPQGVARLAAAVERPVEGAITGNFTDSFVTGLMQRKSDLEQALTRGTKMTPDQVRAAVDGAIEQRLQRHYQNNPAGLTTTRQTLADAEAKAKELATDFKGLNTFVERTKNTMFPIDIGFLGQNVLTGMRQGGIQTLAGMANRVALALNLPFATDLEKATGLPRILAASNDGLRLGNVASGLKPDEGTLLAYIPGIKAVDKHAVVPLISKLTDAQYNGLGGFLKMMNYEGNLMVLGAAGKDVADPAVRREAARVTNNAWSSAATATTPGRAQVEKLTLTSPAFTRSQVGQLTDMAKLITPGASETQRILAATAVLSNAVMIAGVYKVLNDQFGIGDPQLDPTKPGFGNIILPTTNSDGKHQVINMFPQRSFQTAIIRATEAVKDEDPEAFGEALARLGAGRAGALPSSIGRAAGYGYDTQGKFYMGGMPWSERGKASLPIPVTAQNAVVGGPTDLVTMGFEVAGVPNYPESTGSQLFRESQDVKGVQTRIVMDDAVLKAAFPNNPEMVTGLMGQEWASYTSEEKKAMLNAAKDLYPNDAKALAALDETRKQYNEEKPTALSNRIRIQQETDDRISSIRQEYGTEFNKLGEKFENGQGDPRVLRQTLSALRESQNQEIGKEYWKGGTTYAGLPEVDTKGSKRIDNEVQEAIAVYRDIGSNIARVEGKPNYDAIQAARDGFIVDLYRSSPETAARLDFYLSARAAEAEAQKPEFLRFWDNTIIPALNRYYEQPEGGRTAWRGKNPMDDALLTFAGYMPSVASPMAGELLYGMAPGRKPK